MPHTLGDLLFGEEMTGLRKQEFQKPVLLRSKRDLPLLGAQATDVMVELNSRQVDSVRGLRPPWAFGRTVGATECGRDPRQEHVYIEGLGYVVGDAQREALEQPLPLG